MLAAIGVGGLLFASAASARPAQILLIRHAEKPDNGPELSARGWQRAYALPRLFQRPEFYAYGTPAALYAMAPSKPGGSVRALQTLSYISQQFGLPLRAQYTRDQTEDVLREIANDRSLDGKLVVICWQHEELSSFVEQIGVPGIFRYPKDVYDRVWLVHLAYGRPTLYDLPQRLLPGDSPY